MKGIILAAGKGTRLAPYTNDRPKCLVEYEGKPILEHILKTFKKCQLKKTIIISGYKAEKLSPYGTTILNERFNETNMVYSLFCAEKEFNEDLIVSYSDIIYHPDVLQKLISSKNDISVVIDKNWHALWSQRMENPLSDAESLKISKDGLIGELGQKAFCINEIEGQYIGLLKFSANILPTVIKHYHNLKERDSLYMTDFIQDLINSGAKIAPVWIENQWVEVDEASDLKIKNNATF